MLTPRRASDSFLPTQLESRAPGLYPGGFGAIPNVGSRFLPARRCLTRNESAGSNPARSTAANAAPTWTGRLMVRTFVFTTNKTMASTLGQKLHTPVI